MNKKAAGKEREIEMTDLYNFISNFDDNLIYFIDSYGELIYILLFLLVYLKTAFVILTFIPGDSLVFASGALAALDMLNLWILLALFIAATISGDCQNFSLGTMAKKLHHSKKAKLRLISDNKIETAQNFLQKYGQLSVILARFVPLMRTTVPFVGGFTSYSFSVFFKYNSLGGIAWTTFWLSAGLLLGNLTWVENNLVLSLFLFSIVPFIIPTIYLIARKGSLLRKKGMKKRL
ncbi:DedA family protein [Metabacillus fastidiosus]|uniref:DedA family protein n=1 Tax=Metabacillus fastidiosus TaxID=1458 RepID=UPI002DBD06FE|nr:VTT domain-containing protein [Metabacillus fastidiosus]MEC2078395.1 VTT domain-containing protein [Metabacillus fastidiosus]